MKLSCVCFIPLTAFSFIFIIYPFPQKERVLNKTNARPPMYIREIMFKSKHISPNPFPWMHPYPMLWCIYGAQELASYLSTHVKLIDDLMWKKCMYTHTPLSPGKCLFSALNCTPVQSQEGLGGKVFPFCHWLKKACGADAPYWLASRNGGQWWLVLELAGFVSPTLVWRGTDLVGAQRHQASLFYRLCFWSTPFCFQT